MSIYDKEKNKDGFINLCNKYLKNKLYLIKNE